VKNVKDLLKCISLAAVIYFSTFQVSYAKEYKGVNSSWEVYSSDDNSRCVVVKTYKGYTAIMMAIYPNDDEITLSLQDNSFSELEDGKEYSTEIEFFADEDGAGKNNIGLFKVRANDDASKSLVGFYSLEDLNLHYYNFGATDFTISVGSSTNVSFSLTGIAAASDMWRDCIDSLVEK